MNKIEVLNFYDELTNDQKQSFMMLMDTLGVFCEKRSREDDISVRENML
ncbi:hypothetical protein MKD01_01905 [[Clostridium] innocuum]|nr:hypothetical protein [[Clostridium] innocuum]MCR0284056.1 hypothetical protein [[Clostridium] innocuum]MCR0386330.1 hypothetical protein [[Clostridium] innocuum]MDU3788816.1 hypothetical protein [Erysipelotrichaceae bacterium]